MVNEWRALRRVGEWAGLEEESLEAFLEVAQPVHDDKLDAVGEDYDLDHEYFAFLNAEVFADEQVVSQLDQLGVEEDSLHWFRTGRVPIEEAFEQYRVMDYDLDEIVDFVMLLKFVDEYLAETGEERIAPRNRLQHLLYLVNYRLSEQSDPSTQGESDLGMLSRTGYRYTFRKLEIGPASNWLYTDKDRLYAWQLLDEEVIESGVAEEDEPFGVGLGRLGNLLMTRFDRKLHSFESVLLKEWDLQQQSVIRDFAAMPQSELRDHVTSIGAYQARAEGQILLNGRPRRFDEEAREEMQPAAGVITGNV